MRLRPQAKDKVPTVSIEVGRHNVALSVVDQGHGMDKETLRNIFTPFYTKKKEGTGLSGCL